MMLLSGQIFLPCLMSIKTLPKGEVSNAGSQNLKIYLNMKRLYQLQQKARQMSKNCGA